MENLEIYGKTVEEATKKALTQLNVGLDEVEISVLNEGRGGILGLGAEDARISVRLLKTQKPEENVAQVAQEVLEELLQKLDVKASAKLTPSSPDNNLDFRESITFNIVGEDIGILIGRRGQTLDSIQYLLRLITAKRTGSRLPINLDVENYKQHRYEDLRTLALNVAQQVKIKKLTLRLEPMSAFERRIIHLTLADDPDVTTESVGQGDARKVMIIPKPKK
jgi:spoIIIJ-associated protein